MTWLLTNLIKAVSKFISLWPRRLQLAVGALLGLTWYYVIRIRRQLVMEHLSIAFPDLSQKELAAIARKNFINYGQGFIEFLLLPAMDENLFKRLVVTEGFENYQKAAALNKGVFLVGLHIGNWEMMTASGVFLGLPLHVVTKKLKAKRLNKIWTEMRVSRGIKLLREEKSTFDILRALRSGGAVGFVLDQFLGPPVGVRTKFFGRETGTAAGLALFADRTRSPVVPVYNLRQPDGKLKIIFEPAIEFVEQGSTEKNISFMTQVYTSRIEEIVRTTPEQWLWLHRRWKPFRD